MYVSGQPNGPILRVQAVRNHHYSLRNNPEERSSQLLRCGSLNSQNSTYFDSLSFFTNLIHKFFILIHLLHSSTCFEQYCARLQEDNCVSTASGIVTLFR